MKIETSIISSTKSRTMCLMAAIVFIFFFVFFAYLEYYEYEARQKYLLVEREFNQIRPLIGAVSTSGVSNTVAAHAVTVGASYRTNLSYNEVRTYYDAELSRHGFRFKEESEAYGRKRIFYSKGELTAWVDYAGVANPEYTYYFCVYWNS